MTTLDEVITDSSTMVVEDVDFSLPRCQWQHSWGHVDTNHKDSNDAPLNCLVDASGRLVTVCGMFMPICQNVVDWVHHQRQIEEATCGHCKRKMSQCWAVGPNR